MTRKAHDNGRKIYVLDTNILLSSPNAIFGFDNNVVVIAATTLQELDLKKTVPGEIGFNAREAGRHIEELRVKGDLRHGVEINESKGIFKIIPDDITKLPLGFSGDRPDNRIIGATLKLIEMATDNEKVILVTNDTLMRINASFCGIQEVQFYKNDHINTDDVYTGRADLFVSKEIIDSLYKDGYVTLDAILKCCTTEEEIDLVSNLVENEFVTLKNDTQSGLSVFRNHELRLIDCKEIRAFGVNPKNVAQKYALYALLAPSDEIPIVILQGAAGTSKTFLSLAAGLEKTYDWNKGEYDKILITRNNVMADADFGYLPGELDEKMAPLLAPFYDNLESLLKRGPKAEDPKQIQIQIDDMFSRGILDICPMAYMRGRSITNSYLIVDEAQNATRSQIRDIITRAGQGTKVVICGDLNQIDTHNLDKWNNGLTFAANKMKGSPLCAQISFQESESVRSELAKEAIIRLKL